MVDVKWDFQGAICTYKSSFTATDTISAIAAIGQLEEFSNMEFTIHDFSGISNISMKIAILITIGAPSLMSVKLDEKHKTAIVTTDPKFEKELVYFKRLAERNIEIFSSIEDAVRWARH